MFRPITRQSSHQPPANPNHSGPKTDLPNAIRITEVAQARLPRETLTQPAPLTSWAINENSPSRSTTEIQIETNMHRTTQRGKQVAHGLCTMEGLCLLILEERGDKTVPLPPRIDVQYSKRNFDAKIANWRRDLHRMNKHNKNRKDLLTNLLPKKYQNLDAEALYNRLFTPSLQADLEILNKYQLVHHEKYPHPDAKSLFIEIFNKPDTETQHNTPVNETPHKQRDLTNRMTFKEFVKIMKTVLLEAAVDKEFKEKEPSCPSINPLQINIPLEEFWGT